MRKFAFETALGPVWFWGDRAPSQAGGLVVLGITGAFAGPGQALFQLQIDLPDAEVFAAYLPGHRCPTLASASVGAWGAAYSEAAHEAFGDRPLVIVGESTGALVALAMRGRNVAHLVLMEPPLVTDRLWPLIEPFRQRMRHDRDCRPFLSNVFGVGPATIERRDYRHLLDNLPAPTTALYGQVPLGDRRPFTRMPSLVDEPERELLRDHPKVHAIMVEGAGHDLFRDATGPVVVLLRRIVKAAQPQVSLP